MSSADRSDVQHQANRMQALAKASGSPYAAKRAARMQSRADELRKIRKAILRYLRSHGVAVPFADICDAHEVDTGTPERFDYMTCLASLVAAGKVAQCGPPPGRAQKMMFRANVVDAP